MLVKRCSTAAIALILGLALVGLTLLVGPVTLTQAAGPTCTVAPAGDYTTIQAAVDDTGCTTIQVRAGTYAENLVITRSLALMGGYNAAFTSRTPGNSIVDGGRVNTTIIITDGGAATIDGFTITGGDGSLNDGLGGGLFIHGATAIVRYNTISDNVASQVITQGGFGGGIYVKATTAPVLIHDNTIQANVGYSAVLTSPTVASDGGGGGINCDTGSSAVITGNMVQYNWAARTDVPSLAVQAFGAGISVYQADSLLLDDNTIQYNMGAPSAQHGFGGGVEIFDTGVTTVTDNTIMQNTLVITGPDVGGAGLYWGAASDNQKVTLTGNRVQSNTGVINLVGASGLPDPFAAGGGMSLWGGAALNDMVTMEYNYLAGNIAAVKMSNVINMGHVEGGGLWVSEISTTHISRNTIEANIAVEEFGLAPSSPGSWGGRPTGGGMHIAFVDDAVISQNLIQNNVTARQQQVTGVDSSVNAGGLSIDNVVAATVTTNTIANNVAVMTGSITSNSGDNLFAGGGGLSSSCYDRPSCQMTLGGNTILTNTTALTISLSGADSNGGANGGGLALSEGTYTLSGNHIEDNVAFRDGEDAAGGAIDINQGTVQMSQNQVLDNWTTGSGDSGAPAVWVWKGTLTSINDVIAYNTGGLGTGTDNPGEPATATVINDTFYENGERGIEANDAASTIMVTNTIIYSHSGEGLRLNDPASTLIGNYNLLSNTTNYDTGVTAGANDITDVDPLFLKPGSNDFHLQATSPAIDGGTSTGAPTVDFEDDTRPSGAGVDIGADELLYSRLHLPFILKP